LKFGFKITVCTFGQFIEAALQEGPPLLEMGTISILIHINRLSPDENPFGERTGKKEVIPSF
jgi:hypothetical protein